MTQHTITLHYNDLPATYKPKGSIAIDTETMGLNLKRDRLCVVQIKDEGGEVHLVKFVGNNYNAPNLKKLLADSSVNKIFHFARFDIAAIYLYLGVMCNNVFCTKIASKLTRTYTSYHGLKELCKELIQVDLKKDQQTSFWGAPELSEDQKNYAASDVLYLHQIKEVLIERLKLENRLNLANNCFNFLPSRVMLDVLGYDDNSDIFTH